VVLAVNRCNAKKPEGRFSLGVLAKRRDIKHHSCGDDCLDYDQHRIGSEVFKLSKNAALNRTRKNETWEAPREI
jgi:hypothetical protein